MATQGSASVSEFTRRICRQLCVEKAIDMEIGRLNDKLRIMKERGALSETEAEEDAFRRAQASRLIDVAETPIVIAEPPSDAIAPERATARTQKQLTLDMFDQLSADDRRAEHARKKAVEYAGRKRL